VITITRAPVRTVPSGEGTDIMSRRPLPVGAKVVAGVLLAIPLVALALVPTYSHETPKVLGFPFFYWYQLLWVVLTPIFTWLAYVVITRARGEKK
jgi:hypothetical protein